MIGDTNRNRGIHPVAGSLSRPGQGHATHSASVYLSRHTRVSTNKRGPTHISLAATNPCTPHRRPQRAESAFGPLSTDGETKPYGSLGPSPRYQAQAFADATFPTDFWLALLLAPAQPELRKASCRGNYTVTEEGSSSCSVLPSWMALSLYGRIHIKGHFHSLDHLG